MKKKSKGEPQKRFDKFEGFIVKNVKKSYESGKSATIKHGATGLIALLISSVVPMLESWHTDKVYKDEIQDVGKDAAQATKDSEERSDQSIKDLDDRTDKHIIEIQNLEDEKVKALWDYLSKQNNNKK